VAHLTFDGLNDTALVSTEWLADHLGAEGLVVLDATVLAVPGFNGGSAYVSGREQFLVDGHIPGAVFADLFEDFSDPEGEYPFSRPGGRHLERAAQAHGIDNDTAVVVYDAVQGVWAARLWWVFRSFGFEVRVLDGGLMKWRAEGRPLQTGDVRARRAGDFSAYPEDDAWAGKHDVEAVVAGEAEGVLLCAAHPREFAGEVAARPRAGHIPSSISVPAAMLLDPDTNAYLPPERLREVLADVVSASAPIITYCDAGVAAAGDALALSLVGRTDVRVYDGSLNEWAADVTAPLELSGPSAAASAAASASQQRLASRH
jgi:thiosulfate/3-mercaptopyruvate sulfurtransferase